MDETGYVSLGSVQLQNLSNFLSNMIHRSNQNQLWFLEPIPIFDKDGMKLGYIVLSEDKKEYLFRQGK